MKRMVMGVLVAGLTTLMAGSHKYGNTYYHDDGSYTTKSGNTYYHSDGSFATKSGNSVYGSGSYYGY